MKKVDAILLRTSVNKQGESTDEVADYAPTDDEKKIMSLVLKHFVLGSVNMYTPRVEFNDLSLITRDQYDQMAFNTLSAEQWRSVARCTTTGSSALTSYPSSGKK